MALEPDQSPDAVQLVASVDDQLKVMDLPRLKLAGVELMLTVGSVATGG